MAAVHDEKAKTDKVVDAERDTVAVVESKDDKVVENDKVPQVCASKVDVEQVTEARSSNSSSALQQSANQSLPLDSTMLHRKL